MTSRKLWNGAVLLLMGLGTSSCSRAPRPPVLGVFYTADVRGELASRVPLLIEEELEGVVLRTLGLSPRLEETVEQVRTFLREERPAAVVILSGSRPALTLAPLLAEARVPHILAASTSDALVGITPFTHRLAPSNHVQGRMLASFGVDVLGMRRPAVIYQSEEYGASVKDGLVRELAARGVTDVFQVPLGVGGEVEALVEGVARLHDPDGVFVATFGASAVALAAELDQQLPDVPVVGSDATVAAGGPLGAEPDVRFVGQYVATFWLPDSERPEDQAFLRDFVRLSGAAPTHFTALLRDALLTAATAVRHAPNPRGVQRYLMELGDERPPLEGLTGPVHFRGERDDIVEIGRVEQSGVRPIEWEPRLGNLGVGRSRRGAPRANDARPPGRRQ